MRHDPPLPNETESPAAESHKKAWTKPTLRPLYQVNFTRSGSVVNTRQPEEPTYRPS